MIPRSAVNGPGDRFVVWVQGCSLHCPGCWNPGTWSRRPATLVPPGELAGTIATTPGIEGVTLTGGEPFDQAAELAELAACVRSRGLSVMIFTGYDLDELNTDAHQALLAACDVIVTGRYRQEERTLDLTWRGSANQEVHFVTARYGPRAMPAAAECEVHIAADGSLTLTGFPPPGLTDCPSPDPVGHAGNGSTAFLPENTEHPYLRS
jgi:anaerobic ribonucleoside-triphosphate reductase activating protein